MFLFGNLLKLLPIIISGQWSIPKIKVLSNRKRGRTWCAPLQIQQDARWNSARGLRHRQLTLLLFHSCCLKFLQDASSVSAGLNQSRSNLVFEIRNNFMFGMLYSLLLFQYRLYGCQDFTSLFL